MNIRDLKYLISVAELKHFGRAAEYCFVSQPTLSAQIKKLEEELGITIFERNNKQVIVTSVGEKIVAQARSVLQEVDQLKHLAKQIKDPFSGELKLGVIPTLSPYLMPHVLSPIKSDLPKVRLLLVEEKTEHLIKQLKYGILDVALIALPFAENALMMQKLFAEPFMAAVPSEHPLSAKSKMTIEDLADETLLLLEEGHCMNQNLLAICNDTSPVINHNFRSSSIETLRHMVIASRGVTLLPSLAVTDPYQHPLITTIPFKNPAPSRNIVLIWRKQSYRQACFEKLGNIITATVNRVL